MQPSQTSSKHVVILKSNLGGGGGLEKYTLRTAKAFAEKGCRVTILTSGKPPSIPPKVEMVNFEGLGALNFQRLRQFDRKCLDWFKQHHADVVFGMDRNSFQTHYRAGNGVHAEYLEKRAERESLLKRLSFKINPMHRTILNFERETYQNPNLRILFTNSYMVAREIHKHYSIDDKKIQVVHNGMEWEEMEKDFKEWQLRQVENCRQFGLDPCCFQFLFVGHDYERKGLRYLLQGLANLSWQNFQLSVVGHERNRKPFQELARQLGLEKKVFFFGPQSHVRSFYQMADVLVIPSLYDPFANVTVEALAMGLFVVSSPFNGGSEVLTSSNGIVIPNLFDPNEMVKALETSLGFPKTPHRAQQIRDSVKHLDFKIQLNRMVEAALVEYTETH